MQHLEAGQRSWTDSKLHGRDGGGVFCGELPVKIKFTLPNRYSVSQAEVASIKETVDWLLTSVTAVNDVNIYSDIQAAIRGLESLFAHSKLVGECVTFLSIGSQSQWHRGKLLG